MIIRGCTGKKTNKQKNTDEAVQFHTISYFPNLLLLGGFIKQCIQFMCVKIILKITFFFVSYTVDCQLSRHVGTERCSGN